MDMLKLVVAGVQKCCTPRYVILYGEKVTMEEHRVKSADFCIVLDEFNRSKDKLLRDLYLTIQTEIPVQFLLYTTKDWEKATRDPNSYASRIQRRGRLLYGEKA